MKHFLAFIIALFACTANAQTGITVTGRVTDDAGNAIERATVTMTRLDDGTKLAPVITGNDGTFMIDSISEGRYTLGITCVGYDKYNKKLRVSGPLDLGAVVMGGSAKMLDEVTVMADYSSVKSNGTITVRVKGNPLAKGLTLLDFMKFMRGVSVRGEDVSVYGRQNTLIYLEEQEITQEQMKTIDPSMISHIDVITNPDASYGLGIGGVIKIYLRDDGGVLGTLTFNGRASQDGLLRALPGLNLLYARGKVRVSNLLTGSLHDKSVRSQVQNDVADNVETQTETNSVTRGNGYLMDNLALRYSPTDLDRIYVYGGVRMSNGETSTNSHDGTDILNINSLSKPRYYSAGLQYKHFFRKDSVSYFFFRGSYSGQDYSEGLSYVLNSTADNARLGYNTNNVSIDPVLHMVLNKKSNLNAGLVYGYMYDKHDDTGTTQLGYIRDGRYVSSGTDYGAWVDYSTKIGKFLYVQGTLNYHGTKTVFRDRIDSKNNVDLWEDGIYPSIFAQWNLSKEENPSPAKEFYINFNYQYYYSLPNYNYTLPTVTWQGQNQYSIGNPDLTKENRHDFYVWLAYHRKWTVYYDFNYGDNLVKVIMHADPDRKDTYFTRPENAGWQIQHKLSVAYQTKLFNFWYTNTEMIVRNRRESMPGKSVSQTSLYFSTSNNFKIAKNYGITLDFAASTKTKTLSYEYDGWFNLNAQAYMSLLKNKLNVNLSYNGVFYNRPKMTVYGDGWMLTRKYLSHNTSVSLNVSWNFSIGKKIKDNRDMPSIGSAGRAIPTF